MTDAADSSEKPAGMAPVLKGCAIAAVAGLVLVLAGSVLTIAGLTILGNRLEELFAEVEAESSPP